MGRNGCRWRRQRWLLGMAEVLRLLDGLNPVGGLECGVYATRKEGSRRYRDTLRLYQRAKKREDQPDD